MERERLTVEAAGRRLAVERLTPDGSSGTGPTLVFLHEGLGSIGLWKDIPDRLAGRLGLPALVYDRWGHGGSEPFDGARTARYLHDEAELFLPALLDALGVAEVALVGHSDGGTIALLHAAAFPERTRALVAVAAHVLVEDVSLAGIRAAVGAYERGDLRRRLARQHGERTDAVFRAWADTWLAPWFRGWNVEDALPRIRAPVLVVQGEADPYGTRRQVDAIAAGVAGPCRTLLLPGLGHAPHHEARDAVVDALASFLAEALAAGRPGP
jgi:pimeloyl-ACP methyl ester carboxylesterase